MADSKKHSDWFSENFLGKNKEGGPGSGRRPGGGSSSKKWDALGKSQIGVASFVKKSDAIKKGQAGRRAADAQHDLVKALAKSRR